MQVSLKTKVFNTSVQKQELSMGKYLLGSCLNKSAGYFGLGWYLRFYLLTSSQVMPVTGWQERSGYIYDPSVA